MNIDKWVRDNEFYAVPSLHGERDDCILGNDLLELLKAYVLVPKEPTEDKYSELLNINSNIKNENKIQNDVIEELLSACKKLKGPQLLSPKKFADFFDAINKFIDKTEVK